MPYVKSIDCEQNRENKNPLCEFTKVCPVCGTPIRLSNSGKLAYCPNVECDGRKLARVVNMLQKLNLKGFAESTIRQLNVYTLKDLCTYDEKAMTKMIGPGNASNFITSIRSLMANPIEDFRVIGALGFTNTAAKTWKIIFSKYSLSEFINLMETRRDNAYVELHKMKGIGAATIDTILSEYEYFKEDIDFINTNFNVTDSKYLKYGKQIRFSGCRDKFIEEYLKELGHDADGSAGVTKNTDILLIPYEGYSSTKTQKVSDKCLIIPLAEFVQNRDQYL
jgi:NAD-dependent DNA ligase